MSDATPPREFWADYRRALMKRLESLKQQHDADKQLLEVIERQFNLGRREEPPAGR